MGSFSVELSLLKTLKPLSGHHILVAVSGGRDSLALLAALNAIKNSLQLKISVAIVHHGMSSDSSLQGFRHQTWNFVRRECHRIGLPLYSNFNGHSWVMRPQCELK